MPILKTSSTNSAEGQVILIAYHFVDNEFEDKDAPHLAEIMEVRSAKSFYKTFVKFK